MKKLNLRREVAIVGLVIMSALGLTACSEQANDTAARSDQCGVVVGDGRYGRDADIHKVIYPGQIVKLSEDDSNNSTEEFKAFPCNSRNFIINPEGSVNANGDPVGDWHEPIQAVTKDGTLVNVWVTMLWTPNQDREVLENQFVPFCEKYNCFGDDKSENFSSKGWNGMLAENVPFAMAKSVLGVMPTLSDNVWLKKEGWAEIEKAMSASFSERFSVRTGFGNDLFCGSGDVSGWDDPSKPGEGNFTCGQVRFDIENVEPADPKVMAAETARLQAERQQAANTAMLNAAKAKYGDKAGEVLGNLDLIAACKADGVRCVVNIGRTNPNQ